MKKLLVFIFALSGFCSFAQPTIQWQKSLGGTQYDRPAPIQQTNDSGYIIAGYSGSNDSDVTGNHGSIDYWVVKINSVGAIQWEKCLGGTQADGAASIQQTNDGGYIIAGNSSSNDSDVTGNHGYDDYWIVKINNAGSIQWQESLGGTLEDEAYSIQQTSDNGYIVAGMSSSRNGDVTGNHGDFDYWVVKLNSIGYIQWQKSLGGTLDDEAYSIQQTTDSGYIVAGRSTSNDGDVNGNHGYYDYWIVKLSSSGTIQLQKSLGGTNFDAAASIQQTSDSGYIVAGNSNSNDGNVTGNHGASDRWVVKLNSGGSIQWQKSLGGSNFDGAASIRQTSDSGYIVAGNSNSNDNDVTGAHGNYDYWIVKLNSQGNIVWQKCLGGTSPDYAISTLQTTDNGYIVAGNSFSNDGDATGNNGAADYWIVKLAPVISGIEEANSQLSNLQIVPNPVSQSTTVSFSLLQSEKISINIYDITGRLMQNLFNGNLNSGEHQIKWNVADENKIDDGVYLMNISGESFSRSCKLVVVKQ